MARSCWQCMELGDDDVYFLTVSILSARRSPFGKGRSALEHRSCPVGTFQLSRWATDCLGARPARSSDVNLEGKNFLVLLGEPKVHCICIRHSFPLALRRVPISSFHVAVQLAYSVHLTLLVC